MYQKIIRTIVDTCGWVLQNVHLTSCNLLLLGATNDLKCYCQEMVHVVVLVAGLFTSAILVFWASNGVECL